MMKKVLLSVIITLFLASPALATGLIDGFCEQGNKTVAVGGLTSTTKVQASYPLCTITVYLAGTGTLAPALYSDISNTPLANPFTATAEGHWLFYTADGRYDVVLSGGGMAAPVTRAGLQAQGILTAGTNITIVNDSISSYGGVSSIVAGTDITVSAATGAVTISLASGIVSAPFITETAVAGLTGEFALSSLATGILKNTITTGIPSIAVAGSDYQFPMTAGTGITITSNAISRNVIDLASADVTGDLPLANLAQASAASKILGRGSASGAGDYQELSLGTGLSLSGTTLSATGLVTSIVAGTGITVSAATGDITVSATGSGDVVGPGSATDNAIVRFDSTTGKLIQNSGVTISDAGNITFGSTTMDANTTAGMVSFINVGTGDYSSIAVGGIYSSDTWGTGLALPSTLRSAGDKSILYWNPRKGAFAAIERDTDLALSSIGDDTFMSGYNVTAGGFASIVMGGSSRTDSTANYSFVSGFNNTAGGQYNIVQGRQNSIGDYDDAILIGSENTMTGFLGSVDSFVVGTVNHMTAKFSGIAGDANNCTLTSSDEHCYIYGANSEVDADSGFGFGINIFSNKARSMTFAVSANSGPILSNTATGSIQFASNSTIPTLSIMDAHGTGKMGTVCIGPQTEATCTYGLTVSVSGQTAGQTVFIQDATSITGKTTVVLKGGAVAGNILEARNSANTLNTYVTDAGTLGVTTAVLINTSGTLGVLNTNGTIFMSGIGTASGTTGADACFSSSQLVSDSALCIVSAARFKNTITDINRGLDIVMQMRPVNYYHNDPYDDTQKKQQFGFIADEVEKLEPRLVTHEPDGRVRSFLYVPFTAILAKSIQEQQAEIEELKVRISTLEGR